MEIIKNKDNKLAFAEEISNPLINSIRRHVHEIPTLAVDEVEIAKNDSALHDETLAHRIGLVPLKNKKTAKEMYLNSDKEGTVYSEELQGDTGVAFKKIPLTLLQKGQQIELKAHLRQGKGSEHSKFVPGLMHYREEKEITLPKKYEEDIQNAHPDADIKESGQNIVVKDNGAEDIADFVEGLAERQGNKVESKNTGRVIVNIESFGQMKPSEIFQKAIEQLKSDIETVSKTAK